MLVDAVVMEPLPGNDYSEFSRCRGCVLSKRWLAMDFCSASDIPAFRQHATILSRFRCVTIDGVWIGELDLLTTCKHHSELHFTDR
jgi:hypothetical protein